jgi:hypothetical protein
MLHQFQQQISDSRRAIRLRIRQKHLYNKCVEALKAEKVSYRKAGAKLSRLGIGARVGESLPIRTLFYRILEMPKRVSKNRNQTLLAKLNQMAGKRIIEFLINRLSVLGEGDNSVKALETHEEKIKRDFEKRVSKFEDSQSPFLVNFFFKIEDLKMDLIEAESAISLGSKAQEHLLNIIHLLNKDNNWAVIYYDGEGDFDFADEVFKDVVNAHIFLCALKNHLWGFTQGREFILHLEAITDFKGGFFHNWIVDWEEERKIKLTLFYSRKTLNSLEVILKIIRTRKIKIDNEIKITSQECNAIVERIK